MDGHTDGHTDNFSGSSSTEIEKSVNNYSRYLNENVKIGVKTIFYAGNSIMKSKF